MEELKFKSLEDLYKHLHPCLESKIAELKRKKINILTEEDIWDYFRHRIWPRKKSLSLYDLTDDILNFDDSYLYNIIEYKHAVLKRKEQDDKNNYI